MDPDQFATGVMSRLGRLQERTVIKAAAQRTGDDFGQEVTTPVGHPAFADLKLGQTATCPVAVAFLDLRAFTARSFWQPLEEIARLSIAVLGQVADVGQESGGHVLGLRGDGVMAGWGSPDSDGDVDTALCMATCAFSLDAVEGALNKLLAMDGIQPVQLRAGADHGEVCFARTGTSGASEVNIVGFAANFAAKCEKYAHSWEVVVGEGAAEAINSSLLSRHPESPKSYEQGDQRRYYNFYTFAWRQILAEAASAIAQVGGQPTSTVNVDWKELLR